MLESSLGAARAAIRQLTCLLLSIEDPWRVEFISSVWTLIESYSAQFYILAFWFYQTHEAGCSCLTFSEARRIIYSNANSNSNRQSKNTLTATTGIHGDHKENCKLMLSQTGLDVSLLAEHISLL